MTRSPGQSSSVLSINSSNPSTRTLPSLPFELQLSILCQVPPNQLFVLRCVSQSWNAMLSNPGLLEAINNTLPFFTSAPDLTSRMKRRMRMARGEPVWVKPLSDVFPWTLEYGDRDRRIGFSDGWLVYLYSRANTVNGSTVPVKLIIGGLYKPGKVELDLVDVLREVNPEVYREWLGEGFPDQRNPWAAPIQGFHLHVQEGMLVVGLTGINFSLGEIRSTYFFIFSLESHKLLQHIHIIPNSPNITFRVERHVTHVNNTHFLLITGDLQATSNTSPEFTPFGGQIQTAVYEINIYPLAGPNTQRTDIIITALSHDLASICNILSGRATAIDHLGRVWFPFIATAVVSTPTGENKTNNDDIRPSLHMHELPRSKCGRWVILDPATLLIRLQRPAPTSADESFLVSEGGDLAFLSSGGIGRCGRAVHVLETISPDCSIEGLGHLLSGPLGIRVRKFIPTVRSLHISGCVEINLRIPDDAKELRHPHEFRRPRLQEIPDMWGYRVRGASNIVIGDAALTNNVFLIPFREDHGDGRLSFDEDTWEAAEAVGWKRARHGLPGHSHSDTESLAGNDGSVEHPTPEYFSMSQVWGDDGAVCWAMYYGGSVHDFDTWVVCYEEDYWRP